MKKVGIVLASTAVLACGAVVPVALGAATAGPAVSVQIKSLTKSLFGPANEHGEKGSITKYGAPKGACSGDSAAGALDQATHGRWVGKYYSSYHDYLITSIDGVKPAGADYWSIYVNGKTSNVGACEIKLRAGEKLLFKVVK